MEWLPVFLKLSALWLPHGIFQSLLRGLFLLHSRIEKLLSIVFAHLLLWLLLLVLLFSSLGHPNFKTECSYRPNHIVYVVPHPFQVSSPLPAWSEHECS